MRADFKKLTTVRLAAGALAFLLFAWTPSAVAQDLLSPVEFRDAAVAVIQARAPDARIEVLEELSVSIRRGAGKNEESSQFNFDNAYTEYQRDPTALADIIDRWARLGAGPPEDAQLAERVVSVLRTASFIEGFHQMMAGSERPSPPVWRAFAGDIIEVIVFDGDETIQYATVDTLAEVGFAPHQAWEAAPRNLPARLGELEVGGVEGADRVAYVTGGNGLAPSSLIDGAICRTEAGPNLVFLIVERNGYLMADRSDRVALDQFIAVLNDIRRDPQAFSRTPLACREGRLAETALTD